MSLQKRKESHVNHELERLQELKRVVSSQSGCIAISQTDAKAVTDDVMKLTNKSAVCHLPFFLA